MIWQKLQPQFDRSIAGEKLAINHEVAQYGLSFYQLELDLLVVGNN